MNTQSISTDDAKHSIERAYAPELEGIELVEVMRHLHHFRTYGHQYQRALRNEASAALDFLDRRNPWWRSPLAFILVPVFAAHVILVCSATYMAIEDHRILGFRNGSVTWSDETP